MSRTPARPDFPEQYARTRRFSLGAPRTVKVGAGGARVAYLRAPGPTDPVHALWAVDVAAGAERLVVDPAALADAGGDLPDEERARRERARELAGGIVAFGPDAELRRAVFALNGRLWLADLDAGGARPLETADGVVDPRLDPTGRRAAYLVGGALCVTDLTGPGRILKAEDDPEVSWGAAEFVAAEELDRDRGYWWSPDGERLVAARVNTAAVQKWYIGDPADPARPPYVHRYPAAGTANAEVAAYVLELDGNAVKLDWDGDEYCYLENVLWAEGAPLTLVVLTRDQHSRRILVADPGSGRTEVAHTERYDYWVPQVAGVPAWLADGRLVTVRDTETTRRVWFGDEPVTPPELLVREVPHVGADWALVAASRTPTEVALWRVGDGGAECLTPEPGVHGGVAGGDTVVITSVSLHSDLTETTVQVAGAARVTLANHGEVPVVRPRPLITQAGPRECWTALLLPADARPGEPLPVLLDPYGGPAAQRVLANRRMFSVSQWFADQGFAVVVIDGRGTPGRSPAWDHSIAGDRASPALEDQVETLQALAAEHPELDLGRVAIRGWSYGGYLAALGVLRRPDVFHAAVAGAPPTDMHLYDTAYMERYLGDPRVDDEPYRRTSLLEDAAGLRRPLLLVHGLADDNVVAAHTLRLSAALLAAGRPHQVLPLPGVTHVAGEEAVAANLLRLELEFLRDALGLRD